MIEILQFGLSDNLGGIETYIKKIHDNIDQTRFHFSFIDMTGDNCHPLFEEEFKINGCNFYKVCPRRVSITKNRRDLEKLFSEHHFDVLHFNENTLSYFTPVVFALKHGCKVIVHSHNSSVVRKTSKILHIINRFTLKFMNVERVAVSHLAGEWAFKKSDYKFFPNGVDTSKFIFSKEKRDTIRRSLHCENKLVISEVASFLPVKNHIFTIEVFKRIKKMNSDAVLWFIGQGATMENIKSIVRENELENSVFFLGRRKDMTNLYCGMDGFILPSLHEGYPNVAMEAQSMGVPCLISDAVTNEIKMLDILEFMPLSAPPEAWAEKLLGIIKNAKIERKDACKLMEEKGASIKYEIQRIETLYESLAEDRQKVTT